MSAMPVRLLMSLAISSASAVAAQTTVEPPEPRAAAGHVAEAKAIAGKDLAPMADGFMCRSPQGGSDYIKALLASRGNGPYRPTRAFGNLYYVGLTFVGSWILKTPDGLIVWDALNNETEARTILVPGMIALGLDPKQIRSVIVTHGHYDHFGGARYLQKTYGARVYASAADWDYMNDATVRGQMHLPYVPTPDRDGVIEDGGSLALGGTTVHFVLTPGHTPGTVSSIFDVADGLARRTVSMWGGTAMPKMSKGLAQYHDSFHKFWQASKAAHTTVAISSHAFVAQNFEEFDQNRVDPHRNHLVLGADGFERFMRVYDDCIRAQEARYGAWGW